MSSAADPGVVYLWLVVGFIVVARSPVLHRPAGGLLVLAAGAAFVVRSALDPTYGHRWLDPERFPAAVFGAAAMAVSWWALRREGLRRRHGVMRPPRLGRLTDAVAVAGVVAVVGLAMSWPAPPPNRFELAEPWFFAGLVELTQVLPAPIAFGALPLALAVGLFAAPWLDTRGAETNLEARRDEVPFFLFAWAVIGWAPLLAGVFWRQAPPELASPLSTRLFVDGLAVPLPTSLLVRELPGLLLLVGLFIVLPIWLPRWRASRGVFVRHRKRLGVWRYRAILFLGSFVAWVPLKVLLRVLFDIGPWVYFPEWGWML